MNYPKPVMKKSELMRMGFTEQWLMYVFNVRSDTGIAWKSGHSHSSPILYDTEELEKLRKAESKGRRRTWTK